MREILGLFGEYIGKYFPGNRSILGEITLSIYANSRQNQAICVFWSKLVGVLLRSKALVYAKFGQN